MRGMTRNHGLSKVSGGLVGPELFWTVPEEFGAIQTLLDFSGRVWTHLVTFRDAQLP